MAIGSAMGMLAGGQRPTTMAAVEFEGLRFQFTAPYQVLAQARVRGIEPRISRFVIAECGEGAVALNVGANCGFLSIVMGLSVGSTGRVVGFESDPFYFDILDKNLRENRLDGRCQALLCSVGNGQGSTRTVDSVVKGLGVDRIDFLKVDVDGPDYDVLIGAKESLAKFHPTLVVEMEANQKAIFEFLTGIGYRHVVDLNGKSPDPSSWPANLVASNRPVVFPKLGTHPRPGSSRA
jgi:Methyltransferase FkbM domain